MAENPFTSDYWLGVVTTHLEWTEEYDAHSQRAEFSYGYPRGRIACGWFGMFARIKRTFEIITLFYLNGKIVKEVSSLFPGIQLTISSPAETIAVVFGIIYDG